MKSQYTFLTAAIIAIVGVVLFSITHTASAATAVQPFNGGTGLTTSPSYGQLLVGNSSSGYTLTSTSSLGITTSSLPWGSITGTLSNQVDLQNALNAKFNLADWYATTTNGLAEGANNLYFTNARARSALSGTYPILYNSGTGGISTVATSSLSLTTASFSSPNVSQWTNDAGYVSSSFSTTSAAYWQSVNNFFSTTSAAYWQTQNNFFSTTSANYWGGTKNYLTGNQTITLTGDVTGSGATSIVTTFASTSIGSNYITGPLGTVNGSTLNRGGTITVNAASSTFLGDNNTFSGNNLFSLGLMALASTTIGNSTQAGGLTINGGATTTGNTYFGANVTIGTSSVFGPLGVYVNATTTNNGTPSGALASTSASSLTVDVNGQVESNNLGLYPYTQPSFNYPSSTVITTFQSGNPFGIGANGSVAPSSNYVLGNQSEMVTTSGNNNATAYSATSQGPYNFNGKYLELWLYVASSTPMQYLDFYITSNNSFSGGSAQYEVWHLGNIEQTDHDADYLPSGQWERVILPMQPDGVNIATTTVLNLSAITGFRLQTEDKGGGAPLTVGINGIASIPAPPTGVVSITFDDGYLSSLTYANQTMSAYGYPGSIFDVPLNQFTGGSNYLTVAQMQALQYQNGWDISCHTYDHPTSGVGIANFTPTQLNYEHLGCLNFLIDNGFGSAANVLAWPIGDSSPLSVAYAKKYFSMARGATAAIPETLPPGNPYNLRAIEIQANTSTSTILADLQNCKLGDEWCIFELHDITASTPTQYQVSTSTFSYFINQINTLGLPVVTLSQVLKSGVSAYTGASCTNQFVRSLNGAGVVTCSTVQNTDLAHSTIVVNGTTLTLGDTNDTLTAASSTVLSDNNMWTGINTGLAPRTVTKVVCASNAIDTHNCDYRATGTNDQTTIQAAINAVASSTPAGGIIQLSEGTFNFGSTGSIYIISNGIVLQGMGQNATYLNQTGTTQPVISVGYRQSGGSLLTSVGLDAFNTTMGTGASTVANIKLDGFGNGSYVTNVTTNYGGYGVLLEDADRVLVQDVIVNNPKMAGEYAVMGLENTWGNVTYEDDTVALNANNTDAWFFTNDADQSSPAAFSRVTLLNDLLHSNNGLASTTGLAINIPTRAFTVQDSLFESNNTQVSLDAETHISFIDNQTTNNNSFDSSHSMYCMHFSNTGYGGGNPNVSIQGMTFQNCQYAFYSSPNTYPTLTFLGLNKNDGNVTNMFTGAWSYISGTDVSFAGSGVLTMGLSTQPFSSVYTNQLCLSSDCRSAWPTTAASSTLLADNNIWTGGNFFNASTTIGNGTAAGGLTINGSATTTGNALFNIGTPAGSTFTVGANGNTNPAFQILASTTNAATGLSLTSNCAGNGVNLNVISSAAADSLTLSSLGTTGQVALSGGTSVSLGGVVLQTGATARLTVLPGSATFAPGAQASTAEVPQFSFTGGANTARTSGTEINDVQFNIAQTKTHSVGSTVALQRSFLINAPTEAMASTNAHNNIAQTATLAVTGAPLIGNFATSTENDTLLLQSSALNASTSVSVGLSITANTGAGTNYAASTTGRWIMGGLTSDVADADTLCLTSGGEIVAHATTGCITSALRFKQDITPLSMDTSFQEIMQLNPVNYIKKQGVDGPTGPQVGLIAEQVATTTLGAQLAVKDMNGDGLYDTVNYQQLTAPIVGAIQYIEKQVMDMLSHQSEQDAEIAQMQSEIAALQKNQVENMCPTQ